MSDDMERMLRNALDAVDHGRRWAMVGLGALFLATLLALFAAMHTGRLTDDDGASRVLFLSLLAIVLLVASCTAILMLHVTRTAKTILRAIELLRKE